MRIPDLAPFEPALASLFASARRVPLMDAPGAEAIALMPAAPPSAVWVIAHGGGNDRLYGYWALIPALLARGEAVLTAHLPGHGLGGTDRFTVEATRARLDALLALAAGLGPRVALLGQSMGGAFALDAVLRGAPVAGVVAVSAPLALPASMPVWRELGAALAPENWPAARQAPPGELLPAVGPYKRDRFPIRTPAGASYLEAFRRALLALDLQRRLAAAPPDAPALILHGRSDGIIPAEHGVRLARAYGDRAELALLPGCHHLDVLIRPRVIDRLTAWLDHQMQQAGV